MTPRPGLCFALLLGMVPGTAVGQRPGTIEVSGLGVWHNKTAVHDGLRGFGTGARFGVWLPAGLGIEAELDWTRPTNSMTSVRYTLLHYGAGVLYNHVLPSGPSFYARLGYGRLDPGSSCTVFSAACEPFSAINGGLGLRVPLSGPLQFRAEGMFRGRSGYDYRSIGASIGFTFLSGVGGVGPAGLADDDSDGVPNRRDRCLATVRGALVDQRGCPTDLDGDLVPDGLDRCPGTPRGTRVDTFGCPVKQPD